MAKYSRKSLVSYIADNIDSPDLPDRVAAFLIDNGKTSELDSILRDVTELRAQTKGVVELTAKTAFPLDAQAKISIQDKAKQQYPNTAQVVVHEVIDPTLIGGADIQFANANLNLSVRAKLNQLKKAVA